MIVVFNSDPTTSTFDYTIRTPFMPRYRFMEGYSNPFLISYGESMPFVKLQQCLNIDFIYRHTGLNISNNVFIQRMPTPPKTKAEGDALIRSVFGTFACLAFLIPLFSESMFVSNEKNAGLNVLMATNGVKTFWNLLSWLLSGILFSVLYTAPATILLKNTFTDHVQSFLYHSNGLPIWLLFGFHAVHGIAFVTHLTSYVSRPRYRVSIILLVYILADCLYTYSDWSFRKNLPFLGILFPNILLLRAFEEVNFYEELSTGVQWENLFYTNDQTYAVQGSIGMVMILSLVGMIFHFCMAVYIHAIIPGKFGVKKPFLYFLKPLLFWRKKSKASSRIKRVVYETKTSFEPTNPSAVPGISIRNLKKTYQTNIFATSTSVEALKGTSIDFYHGQITALLGQNGAGKSTMMSILTGMTSPTEGKVFMNEKDLNEEFDTIISDIGFCPQDDIFFPDLTVFQQLLFFGLLKRKDKSKEEVVEDVKKMLQKLDLTEKQDSLPAQLSGAHKRRVCFGMALIGDASVLILDEPTTSLDPENRRHAWDLILGAKEGKTILISTHNMEEADILGDRIAIIDSGNLKCYGTPMFLKKEYGQGKMEITCSTTRSCNPENVRVFLGEEAQISSFDSGRLKLAVPHSDHLPDRLDQLELQKEELGVTGISVSLITLEQVFIKIIKEDKKDQPVPPKNVFQTKQRLTGPRLTKQRISALLKKKLTFNLKNPSTIIIPILLPVMLYIGLRIGLSEEDTKISIDPSIYNNPRIYNSIDTRFGQSYSSYVKEDLGYTDAPTLYSNRFNLINDLNDLAKYQSHHYLSYAIAGAYFEEYSSWNVIFSATALFTHELPFSLPISLNLLDNAILKAVAGKEFAISISAKELTHQSPIIWISSEVISFVRAFILAAISVPVVALFITHPSREKISGMKHLQLMTGTYSCVYWLAMFIFDLAVFFIFSLILIVCFGFKLDDTHSLVYFEFHESIMMLSFCLLFAVSVIPLMYILSFCKHRNFVSNTMTIAPVVIMVLEFILGEYIKGHYYDRSTVKSLRQIEKYLFYLLPHVSFFNANRAFGFEVLKDAFLRRGDHDISLEESLTALAITSVLYLVILSLLERRVIDKLVSKFWKPCKQTQKNVDEQVEFEKREVAMEINKLKNYSFDVGNFLHYLPTEEMVLLVYELQKSYKSRTVHAVNGVSFKIIPKECFGLLGVNGAGKSTTFRMLTGQEIPDYGNLYLNGINIKHQRYQYLSQMGYCPQNSAIIDTLNAKDHLQLFARLRGVPECMVENEVQNWIISLGLEKHAKKQSGTYSGGNKRRLSFAISMIGNPKMVLLDEPTAGVDPSSRKLLWKVIVDSQKKGHSIILTSHSMEECEVLCNRLGIMVNGQFLCIGPCEQLKQKFGVGFDIQLKLRSNLKEQVDTLKTEIKQKLNCEITYEHASLITCHVTDDQLKWRSMYNLLNQLKQKYGVIEDYTVLSATLEQLFLQFAREAKGHSSDGFNV